jgi:hypothetical protein
MNFVSSDHNDEFPKLFNLSPISRSINQLLEEFAQNGRDSQRIDLPRYDCTGEIWM